MSDSYLINDLIGLIEKQGRTPLAIHDSGTVSYTIHGLETFGGVSGYPILRTTDPTTSHTYLDKGFLLESNRVSGSNGSAANVDLKLDAVNALLLLADTELIYG